MDPRSAGQVQRMLHNMISKHNYCRLLQLGVVACEAGASRTRYNVQCAYVPPATMHLSPWLKHCEQCASACLISHMISHHCGRVCCCETHNGLVACVGGAQPRPEQTLSGQGWLGTTRERAQISTKVKRMRQASSVHGLFLHWSPLQTLVTAANTACKALYVHVVRAAVWHKWARAHGQGPDHHMAHNHNTQSPHMFSFDASASSGCPRGLGMYNKLRCATRARTANKT